MAVIAGSACPHRRMRPPAGESVSPDTIRSMIHHDTWRIQSVDRRSLQVYSGGSSEPLEAERGGGSSGRSGGSSSSSSFSREQGPLYTLIGGEGGTERETPPCPGGAQGPPCILIGEEGGSGTKGPPSGPKGARGPATRPKGDQGAALAETPPPSFEEEGGAWIVIIPEGGALQGDGSHAEVRGLRLGSADPHYTCRDGSVREPEARGRAGYSLSWLDEAEEAELRRRPFPHMNVAPTTDWKEPPRATAGPAPRVHRVEDVVPPATMRRMRAWIGRLRACLKAAARGNVAMATKLRPGDLQLKASEGHMVRGTEAWVWDLRPLERGEEAEPLWPSSMERPPDSSLHAEAVRAMAIGFADQGIVGELLYGVSDDAVVEQGVTVLSPPHIGALRHYAQLMERLERDEAKGWTSGGWSLPFWPIRANAYSVIEEVRGAKTKHRMVIDLSWPIEGMAVEGGPATSVNDAIDRSGWPYVPMVRPRDSAEAMAILLSSGEEVLAWGWDGEAYYRKVGRQRAEVYRNCLWVLAGFVVDEREQFGDASAAVKCVRMSNLIAFAVRRAMAEVDACFPPRGERLRRWLRERPPLAAEGSQLGTFSLFVDDSSAASINDGLYEAGEHGEEVLGVGPDTQHCTEAERWRGRHLHRAQMHYSASIAVLHRMGHLSEASKEQHPSEEGMVNLGMDYDLKGRRMRLTDTKRGEYAERALEAAGQSVCPRVEYESVLHKLLYAASAFPMGRQWLHCLFRGQKASFRTKYGGVPLSARMRKAMLQWKAELTRPSHAGVPMAARKGFPAPGDAGVLVSYSDASGTHGYGAWTFAEGKVLYTCGEWDEEARAAHINAKELMAMAASTESMLVRVPSATHVREFTDNTTAEWAAHRMAPKVAPLQCIMERRAHGLRQYGAYTWVSRIGTKENVWADLLSRAGGEPLFLAMVQELGLEAEWLPTGEGWMRLLHKGSEGCAIEQAQESACSRRTGEGGSDLSRPPQC